MPHHSSRRLSRRTDRPHMPKIFESIVYEEHTSSFTSHATSGKHSSRVEHIRRVDSHDSTGRDGYSSSSRHVLRGFSCCSPDDPHPLSDANKRGFSDHYFEKASSRMPHCCSPEHPHPLHEIDRADLANHWVDNIVPATPSARKTHYENDQLRNRSAHFATSTDGARSTAYRESRYQASPSADPLPDRKQAHPSDRYQDSIRYSQTHRSEQHPRRAPSAREPFHTSSPFDRPKATESRREGASGSKPTHSSKHHEERSRDCPEPKRSSQGQYHSHKEYDSKYQREQDRRGNGKEYESRYQSSQPRPTNDEQYDSRDQSGQSRRHHHDNHDTEYKGSQNRDRGDTFRSGDWYAKKFDECRRPFGERTHADTLPPSPPPPPPTPPPQPSPSLPDHYKILGISPNASADEIKKAARSKRVSTHPDKLKKPGMSESELRKIDEGAASVGQAADVLQDGEQKKVYDLQRAGRWVY